MTFRLKSKVSLSQQFSGQFRIVFFSIVILTSGASAFFLQKTSLGKSQTKEPETTNKAQSSAKIVSGRNIIVAAKTMSEWEAFAVYHPHTQLNDGALFSNFKKLPTRPRHILSAQSLLPILKSAFGDQPRGNSSDERDTWFLTHPADLFTPEQLRALCGRDSEQLIEDGTEICWRAQLSSAYLAALTDFAAEACPQLVNKEGHASQKSNNKLYRNDEFESDDVRNFAQQWLRIPTEKTTEEWVNKIVNESNDMLMNNLNFESTDSSNTASRTEDLYSLSCQMLLLSEEFYSR